MPKKRVYSTPFIGFRGPFSDVFGRVPKVRFARCFTVFSCVFGVSCDCL